MDDILKWVFSWLLIILLLLLINGINWTQEKEYFVSYVWTLDWRGINWHITLDVSWSFEIDNAIEYIRELNRLDKNPTIIFYKEMD